MGLELIIGAASLALGAISIGMNVSAAAQASTDKAASAEAQTEANNAAINQQTNNANYDRRARIREERVRRAQIEQGSQNGGTSGSSGETGALSSLDSNFASLNSQAEGQTAANVGINKLNQTAAQYDENARNTLAWNDVFQSGLKTSQTIFDNWPKT